MTNDTVQHKWRFFRSGGFDQVSLETADDLKHLSELDPKLWTVLNCPTTGLEFDRQTLALLDSDSDGQVRVPEIQAAVRWCCQRLTDAGVMFQTEGLSLTMLNVEDDEGKALSTAMQKVLQLSGKSDVDTLYVADLKDKARLFSPANFNGDGIIVAELSTDDKVKQLLADIVATLGGVTDRSGAVGSDAAMLTAFLEQAKAITDWHSAGQSDSKELQPLGEDTASAVAIFDSIQAKIDDFFVRCQLAAFDSRAAQTLNPDMAVYQTLANKAISSSEADIAALPLAEVTAEQVLPLTKGVNPAWLSQITALRQKVIAPLLGEDQQSLSAAQWADISSRLAAWRAWQSAKPVSALHQLPLERLIQWQGSDTVVQLEQLMQQDLAEKTFADNVDAVEKLALFQRDLVTLLRNFVSLSDFYQRKGKAIFQAGTLYLDQRSCELVLHVSDLARHATMAPFSGCYLVYCSCVRKGEAPINIVAALTGGDVDELMVPGRNGVFYDRKGRDWKASVTKVVAQPVSIRQAFWSPYRRVAAFIEAQMQKFAASRDKDIESKTTTGVAGAATAPAATASSFDIAKFAGIFAAIGLAMGALGTALAAMLAGLFSLLWWQIPMVLLVVMLLISGPSMLMAFLTLRRRNLGPLLDANGWAVNTRARINVPFGAALTGLATLPKGAQRTLRDPYAEKGTPWATIVAVLLLGVLAVGYWCFY